MEELINKFENLKMSSNSAVLELIKKDFDIICQCMINNPIEDTDVDIITIISYCENLCSNNIDITEQTKMIIQTDGYLYFEKKLKDFYPKYYISKIFIQLMDLYI